ncbi:hypothetical protein HGM15179_010235 [Zosterops borbonicus]|uniref:Uncharacterized protein n=1 Tax=Zosterops borbonicus TaxID=364589 RepID=A0A8K1GF58_9PASS|nr:hypothetical protein HGM15179_010235 [Zosterops borbonicus]
MEGQRCCCPLPFAYFPHGKSIQVVADGVGMIPLPGLKLVDLPGEYQNFGNMTPQMAAAFVSTIVVKHGLLTARGMKEESCLQKIYGWEKSHSVSSCPPKPFGKYPHRLTANCNAAIYVSNLPVPDTSKHVDVFGLEKGNGEYLQDVKESELHSRGEKT